MEYQQLILIAFCFYSLFVEQSQLTYAGKHLCARDEAFYLLQFKQGLTVVDQNIHDCDARDKTLSWNNVTGDCCEWDGVTCNGFTGHVIGLDLSCSFLSGTINANNSLTKLGHLQRLNLAFNELDDFPLGNNISELSSLTHLNLSAAGFYEGGMIPPGLSKLSKLVSLDLSKHFNDLQVDRTTFTSLLNNLEVLLIDNIDSPTELPKNFSSSLRILSLEGTNMFGNISDSQLFHLPNLQVLRLGSNPLLTGTLPNFNWNFSASILELDFSGTGIFGTVPESIGNLHSLWYLDLSSNHLSGSIPESIGNLTAIRELTLSGNSLTGNILSSISKLNKLVHLDLSINNFRGSFLESIGNLTAITELKLPFNNFTGTVPSTISKLNKLVDLDLSENHFQGSIPESIGNLTAITELKLSANSFTGNVPSTIRKLKKLSYIFLSSNNFEGSIPDIFANFSELSDLGFDTNNFTGPFPYSIATLTRLGRLELQNNLLTGPLPSNISGLQELSHLDLSFNYFTGTTPPWLFHLPSLNSLYVQHNQFTGKLPNEVKRNSAQLSLGIDLSNNKLQGKIPDWMSSMSMDSLDLSHNSLTGFEKQVWRSKHLWSLNLENNYLQGPLHQSICDMIHLKVLILAQNNFIGSIPGCLGNSSSHISILDLRVNNFHGEIPRLLPTRLQYLGVYGNHLGGQVPRSLVNCTNLVALDLGNNKINDTFPIWLRKLQNLQVLILKSNLFHGPIGDLESEFPFSELRIFDLSFNRFTGTLPSNLFKSFRGMMDVDEGKTGITRKSKSNDTDYLYHVSLVIKGNEFDMRITSIMTSVDLSKECGNNNASPLEEEEDDDDDDSFFGSGFSWESVVIGYGFGMTFGLFIGGLMFLLGKPKCFVHFAEDIAQQIAAKKRRRQKMRRQRRGLRMN